MELSYNCKHGVVKQFVSNALHDLSWLGLDKVYDKIKTKDNFPEGEFIIEGLIGKSQNMQNVYKLIGKASSSDVTVLILGESVTGYRKSVV